MSDPPVSTADLLRRALGARVAARLRRAGATLRDLGTAGVSKFVSQYGLTEVAATKAAAVVELARAIHTEPIVRGAPFRAGADVLRAFGPRLRDLKLEQFWVVLLDGKHRVLREPRRALVTT